MNPMQISQPTVPVSSTDADMVWFPVRITSAPGGGVYVFQEVWTTPGGVIADRVGGRFNTTTDPAYAIDGSTFAVTAAGSPVSVMARRAPGSAGVGWELQGFGSGSDLVVRGGYAANGAATEYNVTTTADYVPPLYQLNSGESYMVFANITGEVTAGTGFIQCTLMAGSTSGWPGSAAQIAGWYNLGNTAFASQSAASLCTSLSTLPSNYNIAWKVQTIAGATAGKIYGLLSSSSGFTLGNTSIFALRLSG